MKLRHRRTFSHVRNVKKGAKNAIFEGVVDCIDLCPYKNDKLNYAYEYFLPTARIAYRVVYKTGYNKNINLS